MSKTEKKVTKKPAVKKETKKTVVKLDKKETKKTAPKVEKKVTKKTTKKPTDKILKKEVKKPTVKAVEKKQPKAVKEEPVIKRVDFDLSVLNLKELIDLYYNVESFVDYLDVEYNKLVVMEEGKNE